MCCPFCVADSWNSKFEHDEAPIFCSPQRAKAPHPVTARNRTRYKVVGVVHSRFGLGLSRPWPSCVGTCGRPQRSPLVTTHEGDTCTCTLQCLHPAPTPAPATVDDDELQWRASQWPSMPPSLGSTFPSATKFIIRFKVQTIGTMPLSCQCRQYRWGSEGRTTIPDSPSFTAEHPSLQPLHPQLTAMDITRAASAWPLVRAMTSQSRWYV